MIGLIGPDMSLPIHAAATLRVYFECPCMWNDQQIQENKPPKLPRSSR
jgi:hypothetical protein